MPDFLIEAAEALAALSEDLVRLEATPDDMRLIACIFRTLHSIKGASGFLGLSRLGRLCQESESLLSPLREGELYPSSPVIALLLRCVAAMQGILETIATSGGEGHGTDDALIAALNALLNSGSVANRHEAILAPGDLQALFDAAPGPSDIGMAAHEPAAEGHPAAIADETRTQPIGTIWSLLPRVVRDLEHKLGKKIDLIMEGAETELDRQVLESIKDPLIQMVRNAADHGLETPQVRSALGKPETGRIRLKAVSDGEKVSIEMADDGRGLDVARIRRKAVESGLGSEGEIVAMTNETIFRFILRPGFSTATEVTSISGRGVGLDIVRTNIERIGGCIDIASSANHGASFTISIPRMLTTAPGFRNTGALA